MSNYSNNNSFEQILQRLLSRVDDSLDKREGSIIYDALAPAAAELAQCYIALDIYNEQSYLLTATGVNLDNRVSDYGITRIEATYAQVQILTYNSNHELMEVPIGTKFATPNEYGGVTFEIINELATGSYIAQCEALGSAGNSYTGELLPLQSINNLGSAIISTIYKPAEDEETDDTLRNRTLSKLNNEPFAGNKSAYRQMAIDIDGVEDCKVFPVWDGGGTVKLAIVAENHTLPSDTFVDTVQEMIDPVLKLGYTCDGSETGTYHFSYDSTNYQFTMPTIQAGDVLIFNTLKLKLYKGATEITTTTGNSGTELTFVALNYEQGTGMGLAPIGHKVTVVSPTQQNINISATLTLTTDYTITQLQSSIEQEINKYINQVQEEFITENVLIIYTSKIAAAILNVAQVKNVSNVKINNSSSDLTINLTGTNVKYPVLNEVVLSEST